MQSGLLFEHTIRLFKQVLGWHPTRKARPRPTARIQEPPPRAPLAGRTIWNVNSTAAGGGVAEMLQVLVGYVQDLDIPTGWLTITGDAGFFAITKRLHNQIHGPPPEPRSARRRPVITHGC